ncbi:MAG: hypothetical protein AAB482_04250, partial [Patescibacteria group bacterium]
MEWYVGFSVFFATVGTFAFLVGMLFDSKKPGVITNSESYSLIVCLACGVLWLLVQVVMTTIEFGSVVRYLALAKGFPITNPAWVIGLCAWLGFVGIILMNSTRQSKKWSGM